MRKPSGVAVRAGSSHEYCIPSVAADHHSHQTHHHHLYIHLHPPSSSPCMTNRPSFPIYPFSSRRPLSNDHCVFVSVPQCFPVCFVFEKVKSSQSENCLSVCLPVNSLKNSFHSSRCTRQESNNSSDASNVRLFKEITSSSPASKILKDSES